MKAEDRSPSQRGDQSVVVGVALVTQFADFTKAGVGRCRRQALEAGGRVLIWKQSLVILLITFIADVIL